MGLRINLCSGQRPFPGWTNVDCNSEWNPDVIADGANMPMFTDGSADIIVIHHGLEHFGLGEADSMLRECNRILSPGGSLIATTPDLEALAHAWLEGRIDDYIYCVQIFGAYRNQEGDRHKWGMTQKTLNKTIANAAGWSSVRAFDWRVIPQADIAKDWYIIGSEAIK